MNRARIFLLALVLGAGPGGTAFSSDRSVEGRIVYVTQDDFYVDVGADSGLHPGAIGSIRRDGSEIGRLQIADTTLTTARLQIIPGRVSDTPRVGDRVVFSVRSSDVKERRSGRAEGQAPKESTASETFVPLLAPASSAAKVAASREKNIFHGRSSFRHQFRRDPSSAMNYDVSRFGTDGSLDRMGGSLWSLDWSGNLSYRDGPAYADSREYREPVTDLFRLALQKKFEAGGFLRMGRFLPQELSGLGYLDGFQAEKRVSQAFRFGAAAGLKPSRDRMAFSAREPAAGPYLTLEAGKRREWYYSGTWGLVGTLFRNQVDQTAFLQEQQMDLGPVISLFSSVEADFNLNASTHNRNSPDLSRASVFGNAAVAPFLSLRAGFDHYDRPNTRAERDFMGLADSAPSGDGYWRSWAGSSQDVFWKLRLDEEVSYINASEGGSSPRWRGGISRQDLPFMPQGRVSVTAYNVYDSRGENYGGFASAYFPAAGGLLALEVTSGMSYADPGTGRREFRFEDYSLRLDLNPVRRWNLYGGMTHSYGDFSDSTFFDTGMSYRW